MIYQLVRSNRCGHFRFALIAAYPDGLSRPASHWVIVRAVRNITLRERDLRKAAALAVVSGTFGVTPFSPKAHFGDERSAKRRYKQALIVCRRRPHGRRAR